ncbi:LysR family transcriptional regulator [Aliamphritea spongicola]|uniref:LysR family transcriptional regulator n=1 Tax=Aliamphritea spongicola TaxID=707589 RepID=UPI00196A9A66|nr:LysR family transcriptional regulator [Aliamphritea spongicola]MBN3561087.1 LysR family transcriptional regulator [Aliamphritea spongicola]
MDKFNSLKMFLAAHDHGSFGAAASALGTDPSTISKAITRLEESLEYQLFYRSTRKLQITEAGRTYLETVRRVLAELDTCENQLLSDNETPSGTLRLNLPVSYGRSNILPLLSAFCRQYPDIKLHVTFSDEYVDIIEQGIDISIRSGTVADSRLVMQKLSPMDFLIVASPEYLQENPISGAEQLAEHPWVRFKFKQTGKLMPMLLGSGDKVPPALEACSDYVVDDGKALVDLCAAGLGLMQAPHFVLRKALQQGRLVSLFPATEAEGFSVCMLYPKRRFLPAKVAVFIEFVKQSLSDMNETSGHTWARDIHPILKW